MSESDAHQADEPDRHALGVDGVIKTSIAMPVVIEPNSNPDGIVIKGWDIDTGRALFTTLAEPAKVSTITTPPTDAALLVVYDGEDGRIMQATVVRADDRSPADLGSHLAVPLPSTPAALCGAQLRIAERIATGHLDNLLSLCGADADKECPLCDDREYDDIEPEDTHRECALAQILGHYGHLVDHDLWCANIGDETAGLGRRASAIKVAELVERHGLAAAVSGDFPKDE